MELSLCSHLSSLFSQAGGTLSVALALPDVLPALHSVPPAPPAWLQRKGVAPCTSVAKVLLEVQPGGVRLVLLVIGSDAPFAPSAPSLAAAAQLLGERLSAAAQEAGGLATEVAELGAAVHSSALARAAELQRAAEALRGDVDAAAAQLRSRVPTQLAASAECALEAAAAGHRRAQAASQAVRRAAAAELGAVAEEAANAVASLEDTRVRLEEDVMVRSVEALARTHGIAEAALMEAHAGAAAAMEQGARGQWPLGASESSTSDAATEWLSDVAADLVAVVHDSAGALEDEVAASRQALSASASEALSEATVAAQRVHDLLAAALEDGWDAAAGMSCAAREYAGSLL